MAHSTGHISATSASIPKPVGGVQLTPNMVENSLAASCAVQAHARAGAYGISDITVEQSPSGRPNVVTNGNTLGVSAHRAGVCADTPGKKRTEHRKVTEGKARGRMPLAFGWTMFSGRLVVCEAHGHGSEELES
eukprot:scaffold11533_cov54-Phaeocystis_antarctica.AAC.2